MAATHDAPPLAAEEAAPLFAPLEREPAILLAVSGGPDSVALLVLLAEWAMDRDRPRVHVATVDHGLRAESTVEAQAVARLCDRLGLSHRILRWSAPRPASALQAKAREARYGLLAAEAARLGAGVIVTAHTLDDQAETVMMRLAAGSGPAGLGAMRKRIRLGGVVLARPILDIPKARLLATLVARGIPYASDPSNEDPRFERVRWRRLMPSLAEGGVTPSRLATIARRLARADDALHAASLKAAQSLLSRTNGASVEVEIDALLAEPAEIALRVLALALEHVNDIAAPRLARLETGLASLSEARAGRRAMTRTLSGCVLHLRHDGMLVVVREGIRARGARLAAE